MSPLAGTAGLFAWALRVLHQVENTHNTSPSVKVTSAMLHEPLTYIVVWWIKDHTDKWQTFHNKQEAFAFYNALLDRAEVYTASICLPIASTDYPTIDEPLA